MALNVFDDAFTRELQAIAKWWRVNRGDSPVIRQSHVRENLEKFGQWKNNSGETCPAYGVFAVTSYSSGVAQGSKPGTTFYREYRFNGPTALSNGGTGYYQKLTDVIALYDSGTPAIGETWGPKPSEWKLFKNYPSIAEVLELTDSTNKYLRCNWHLINEVIGKLDGTLSQGGSQTVSIWAGTAGSEADTTVNVSSCRDWLMKSGATAIASGKKVQVKWINGIPYVVNAECA
jgi:hypothetical protein